METLDASAAGRGWFGLGRIVWTVFAVSIVMYFVVALLVSPVAVVPNAALERALIAVSVAYVGISIPAKRWLLAQAEEVDSQFLRRLALLAPLVLCEAAAVTGLLLRLVVGAPHYYAFLLLALAGMLLHFPRKGQL